MRGPLTLIFCAVATLVIFFGGTWLYFQALAELMILAAALWAFWRGEIPERNWRLYLIPGFLLLVPVLQLIPLPLSWLLRWSPDLGHALANLPKYGIPSPAWHPLSYNPYNTEEQLLWLFTLILAYFVMRRAAQRDPGGIKLFVAGLLALATGVTLYGLYEWRNPDPYILWLPRRFYRGDVAGTYVNRNHYAGMIELILPLGLAWLLDRLPELPPVAGPWPRRLRERLRQVMDALPSRLPLLLVCGLLMAGDVASHSRGGQISLAFAIIVLLLVRFARTPRRLFAALALLLLAGGIFVKAVGVDTDLLRFDHMKTAADFDSGGRLQNWKATLPLVPQHWLLGTGLGTWEDATLRYQVTGLFDHAHNDYLEFALTGGIPFAVVLFSAAGASALRGLGEESRRAGVSGVGMRWLGLGITSGLIALLGHSFVDFNLQIPANILLIGGVLGALGWARRPQGDAAPGSEIVRPLRLAGVTVIAVASLAVGLAILQMGLSRTLDEDPGLILADPKLVLLAASDSAVVARLDDLRRSSLLSPADSKVGDLGEALRMAPFSFLLWRRYAYDFGHVSLPVRTALRQRAVDLSPPSQRPFD